MANISDQQLPEPGPRRTRFDDRYPEARRWLDGQTWELDVEDDIGSDEDVNRFQAALHYQVKVFGGRVVTKTVYRRLEDGTRRRKLLIRASS